MTTRKLIEVDIKQLEDIATLKAQMTTVISGQQSLERKFDSFVKAADKKYATKDEVKQLRTQSNKNTDDLKHEVSWTREKLFDLATKVASLTSTVALITKLMGIW